MKQLMNYLQSPVNSTWLTDGHNNGIEIDLGWFEGDAGAPNVPVFSPGEGNVIETGNDVGGLGQYVVTGHGYDNDWDVYAVMAHFKTVSIRVFRGEVVGRDTQIARMGATGLSNGEHVHMYIVFLRKGTVFSWSLMKKENRANILNHVFQGSGQYARGLKPMPTDWVKPVEEFKLVEFDNATGKDGLFKFTQDAHILDYPHWTKGYRKGTYKAGETVAFEGSTVFDGHTWLYYTHADGGKRFVPIMKGSQFGVFA